MSGPKNQFWSARRVVQRAVEGDLDRAAGAGTVLPPPFLSKYSDLPPQVL